jgi:5-hydroxyisourate hydrolase
MARVTVSTHVLDTERGCPAPGVRVELFAADGNPAGAGVTDDDGRIADLGRGETGSYRIVFHPPSPFFTRVELEIALDQGHYHVPLLISSYGCASYRGS